MWENKYFWIIPFKMAFFFIDLLVALLHLILHLTHLLHLLLDRRPQDSTPNCKGRFRSQGFLEVRRRLLVGLLIYCWWEYKMQTLLKLYLKNWSIWVRHLKNLQPFHYPKLIFCEILHWKRNCSFQSSEPIIFHS